MRQQIVRLLVAVSFFLAACPSFAEENEWVNPLAPPGIPAFSVLNASPETISRPGTYQDLATDIVSGIGSDGRVQQGFGIEISVAEFLGGINLTEYQEKRSRFILQNLRLSLATVRSAGDSASTDAAFAIRVPIFNNADPMRDKDHVKKLSKIWDLPQDPDVDREAPLAAARLKKRELDAEFQKKHWNASRMDVALAVSARTPTSEAKDFGVLGFSTWTVAGFGVSRWGQVLALGRYDWIKDRPNQVGANSLSYGARAVVGSHRFNAFGELVGKSSFYKEDVTPEQGDNDTSGSWSVGLEHRLGNGMWLSTGFGSRFGDALQEADHVTLLAGLRWGVSSEARMAAKPS